MHELLKTEDVAKQLSVSEDTVSRLRKTGKIGYCKIGGQIRFKVEHLEEYLRSVEKHESHAG
jgi:excisionase family DNA binding protein